MQAYLAGKYMTGPKADAILSRAIPLKKKKRKADDMGIAMGYVVKNDDGGWGSPARDEAEEETEVVIANDRSFKKRKPGEGWETVQEGIQSEEPPPVDELPAVVEAGDPPISGVLSSIQLKAKFGKKVLTEVEKPLKADETVYRDSSGRKIDTKAARAEAARLRREKEERDAKKMEWGKGLVQRGEDERRQAELEKEKTRGLARYADDQELNDDQKARERWNDPAAAFLTKSKSKAPRRPTYNGPPPPPNRFRIKPGYRWDGVDRSTGFENKLFQNVNEKKRTVNAAHAWSVEDM